MKERLIIVFLAVLFIASIAVGVMVTVGLPRAERPKRLIGGRKGYAVVRLYGPIRASDEVTIFGTETGSDKVAAELRKLSRNPRVKAVVLRVNSPGGTVAATQEIHREVQRLKEKGIPVVVSISDVGASGAYYVSCGASKILADKGSRVGSIGVISIFPNIEDLLGDKLGIRTTVMTSGKWKDSGSPLRDMTPEERERFEKQIQTIYDQFFEAVREGRLEAVEQRLGEKPGDNAGGDENALEHLRGLAQGQVFLGEDALEEGLIDEVGNLYDAISDAKKLAGLPADAPRVGRPGGLAKILEAFAGPEAQGPTQIVDRLTTVRIEYLYLPGGILK